jgi:hypothetical protein
VAWDDLKRHDFDRKDKDFQEARDTLMPVGDQNSEFVYNHFVENFGNNPDFIDLLAGVKERIVGLPREKVNISGMSKKEKESLATPFVLRLLRDSEIAEKIVESLGDNPDPRFLNWAAELAARDYKQGQGGK